MANHAFCCVHTQSRIDSPEPPSRPPVNIGSIFAAAALPQDHPHALGLLVKKPDVPSNIIRSPNIARKITSQFHRRRSLKVLRRSEEYDGDVRVLGSREIVERIDSHDEGVEVDGEVRRDDAEMQCEKGEVRGEEVVKHIVATPMAEASSGDPGDGLRASVLRSQDWLQPLIRRPADFTPSSPCERAGMAEKFSHQGDKLTERPPSSMPQSTSSPNLITSLDLHTSSLRRTQSFSGLSVLLSLRDGEMKPSPHAFSPTAEQSQARIETCNDCVPSDQVHLPDLHISRQLRSLSAVSDTDADGDLLIEHDMWAFHQREKPDIRSSMGASRHVRLHSSTNSRTYGPCVIDCRVGSPIPSSVYSRPSSTVGDGLVRKNFRDSPQPQHTLGLDGAIADWPLSTDVPIVLPSVAETTDNLQAADSIDIGTLLPPSPSKQSFGVRASADTVAIQRHQSNILLWPSNPTDSPPRKPSSSQLSTSTNHSRVSERFSPPKKSVKKRQSVFKFFRPGSRKSQGRSISTPVLVDEQERSIGAFDGPSDEPGTITVQYELAERPTHPRAHRAASVSHLLGRDHHAQEHLGVPPLSQRRSSLANYELALTVIGDDRRRPSNANLHILTEAAAEDERRQSLQSHRTLTQARPLEDESTNLMAQALAKHQHEKAMFQSPSKHRESMTSRNVTSESVPTVRVDASSTAPIAPPRSLNSDHSELFGPHDTPLMSGAASRTHSASLIAPPSSPTSAPQYSFIAPSIIIPAERQAEDDKQRVSPQHAVRIESALPSWCRYPSHTRTERCGSAGPQDAVLTRDFADSPVREAEGAGSSLEAAGTPSSNRSKRKAKQLIKSGSAFFGDISRYYSNIFSGSDSARNRRSSIATGGWLANPDLELLPPPSPHRTILLHHDPSLKERLQEIEQVVEEQVRKEIRYVECEAAKLEQEFVQDVKELQAEVKSFLDLRVEHAESRSGPEGSFQAGNPFAMDAKPTRPVRASSFVGPAGETDSEPSSARTTNHAKPETQPAASNLRLMLDGVDDERTESAGKSQAEKWSSLYASCLTRAPSTTSEDPSNPIVATNSASTIMAPPSLKNSKARSPDQSARLAPEARIRRFPSVTVVDDCKGHSRSVSLISVKYGGDGILRSSTNDLLKLIEAKEKEEREKLLRGPSRVNCDAGRGG